MAIDISLVVHSGRQGVSLVRGQIWAGACSARYHRSVMDRLRAVPIRRCTGISQRHRRVGGWHLFRISLDPPEDEIGRLLQATLTRNPNHQFHNNLMAFFGAGLHGDSVGSWADLSNEERGSITLFSEG